MLSNEKRASLTVEELRIATAEATRAARTLGQQLVKGERNEDPHPERNAANPAHPGVVRVRLIRPQPVSIAYADIDKVRDHNSFVASLGQSGSKFQ
jgi:hypothetical protein